MKKTFFVILTSIIIVLLTSCYDSTEVDDMIYVLAIGIDYNDGGTPEYTFQAAVPLNISSGIETGFASSEESATLQNIKVSAQNLYTAIDLANQQVTKEINISHCKLILFSREFAEQGLQNQLNSIIQNSELRPTVLVSIADGPAEEFLNSISSPFELSPARYYDMVFEKEYSPQTFSAYLYDFEKSDVVLLPLINTDNQITTSVVKNFTQKGVLNSNETVALNMLTGNYKTGYLTISSELPATILSQDQPPVISINSIEPASITINLSFYGTLTSGTDNIDYFDNEVKKHIELSCEALLKKSTTQFDADIIDLNKHLKKKFITNKAFCDYNWNKKYQHTTFNVNVDYRTIR